VSTMIASAPRIGMVTGALLAVALLAPMPAHAETAPLVRNEKILI
jgi:hypothetical protein